MRLFSRFLFSDISLKKPFCQPFVNFPVSRPLPTGNARLIAEDDFDQIVVTK
jgi:hypothetical protein